MENMKISNSDDNVVDEIKIESFINSPIPGVSGIQKVSKGKGANF